VTSVCKPPTPPTRPPWTAKKKGYRGCSLACPQCGRDAKFINYLPKTFLTLTGELRLHRAYYHCPDCGGHCPLDESLDLKADRLSPGLRPLVCLAGSLASFRDAADDLLRRFAGLRLSANTVRRSVGHEGDRLQERERTEGVVRPLPGAPPWDFTVQGRRRRVAYLGLDAFSVPMQGPGGGKAEGRMLYLGTLYTPDKARGRYLIDFDLERLAGQLRQAAVACGFAQADVVVAVTDGGNGLQEALRRAFSEDVQFVLDWYHATEHLHACGGALHPSDAAAARQWSEQAKGLLYAQGGSALLAFLRGLGMPADALAAEALRKLVNYFADNEHRTDYPAYRRRGWDIGSGPTEAGCKVVGARLKGCGMRWAEAGAEQAAALRALYESGPEFWDSYWQEPRQAA
jgi:hypothetical protein